MNSVNQSANPRQMTEEDYLKTMQMLVASAARNGIVLTVSQRPLNPLAMGNYETVCEARRKLVRG